MNFEFVKLKDISIGASGKYGIPASSVPNQKGLPKYLRITDIDVNGYLISKELQSVDDPNSKKYLLKPNDIVFARTGASTGKSYFYDGLVEDLVYAGFLIKFSLNQQLVNPKYVRYYTLTEKYRNWINSVNIGSTRGNINAKTFGELIIPLPPRGHQNFIVSILTKIDDKIALNNKINKTLEDTAISIYKSWFVDFNHVNNKEIIESEYVRYPKNWKLMKLGDVCNIHKGLSYKGKHLKDVGIPMINLGCVEPGGDFRLNKIKYYDGEFKSQHTVTTGDIIIANTDMTSDRLILGSPIIVPGFDNSTIIFTHHLFAFKDLKISMEYLYYFLKSESFRERAEGYANGTTVLSLSKDDILSIDFIVPDNQILEKFTKIVGNIIKLKLSNDNENMKLGRIRDSLLPKLMSGEIQNPPTEVTNV